MKEDSEREAYSLEHYSLVNDFDLSPRGIWKLLHNFKLASDTIKCRLSKGHSACREKSLFTG